MIRLPHPLLLLSVALVSTWSPLGRHPAAPARASEGDAGSEARGGHARRAGAGGEVG